MAFLGNKYGRIWTYLVGMPGQEGETFQPYFLLYEEQFLEVYRTELNIY